MGLIDRFAYNNRLRDVDPAQKVGLALLVLLLCLLLNTPLVGVVAVIWMWLLAVFLAGLPAATFGRLLLAEAAFFLLATVGIAVSVSTTSPLAVNPWAWQIGPVWISTGSQGLNQAWLVITRTMGGTAALNLLALTTPMVDLVELARRLRLPGVLIDLTTLMYRFIFALLESLNTMRVAQESRLGYHSGFMGSMRSAALLASRLFIDTYQRSQRLQTALDSRGYGGELRVLPAQFNSGNTVLLAGIPVVLTLLGSWWLAGVP